jgi:hypothetical protein
MANNASATVDLKILISVIQNQSQSIQQIQQQFHNMLQQFQSAVPTGAMGVLSNQVGGLNTQVKNLSQSVPVGVSALNSLNATVNTLTRGFKLLTGGFLAFQSVQFVKGLADAAARAQVLQTVLHVVAANAGVTAEEIDKVDQQVQRLGITAASSRESLTKLLQARLAPDLGPKLARASQDLAVISGKDSSETFARLITNIQQLDTLGLRHMGIIVSRTEAEQKYKIAIGATNRELTQREKVMGFANEVLFKAAQLEGTYMTAMGDVSKQVQSLVRLTQQYREILGEGLVPAYAAIVGGITQMFEKLIILAREFSTNREKAQGLADALGTLTTFFTNAAVFLMEHLEMLIRIGTWYLALRTALMLFRGMEIYFLWLVKVADWMIKLRVVITALMTQQIGFAVALRLLGGTAAAASAELAKLSVAQTAVGGTAVVASTGVNTLTGSVVAATAGVRTLGLAWGLAAASLAIPIIGYVIYSLKQSGANDKGRSLLEKGAAAREKQGFGEVVLEDIGAGFLGQERKLTSDEVFEQWKAAYPQKVMMLKTEEALRKQYESEVDAWIKAIDTKQKAVELGAAKAERTAAQTALTGLEAQPAGAVTPGEREVARTRLAEAQREVDKLTKQMDEQFVYAAKNTSTKQMLDQITTIAKIKEELAKERVSEKRTTESVKVIESQLDAENRLLSERMKNHFAQLNLDKNLDAQTKADEIAAVKYKAQLMGIADAASDVQAAITSLFGEGKFVFSEEGVMSGAFAAQLASYEKLLEKAEKLRERGQDVDAETKQALVKGLEPLGKGAALPLDLSRFRTLQPRIQGLEKIIPGITGAAGTAIDTARLGVRDEALKASAEVVAEQKRVAKIVGDERIQTAQEELAVEKAKQEGLNTLREAGYKDGLVGLVEYHDARRERITAEGDLELKLAEEQVRAALAQASIRGQSDEANRRNAIAVRDALLDAFNLRERINQQLVQENRLERERREGLRDEAVSGTLGLRAKAGGTAEALAQLEFDLTQQRKKFGPLTEGSPEAAAAKRFLDLQRVTREAEIFQREREAALQVERDIEQSFRDQLSLQQQARDVEGARDQVAVAKGLMTESEAMRRENARTYAAMDANRAESASRQQDLMRDEANLQRELAIKKFELDQIPGLSGPEKERQLAVRQKELTDEILASKTAIGELAVAYEELGGKITTYNTRLKVSITDGFANAMTQTIMNFKKAGDAWKNMAESFSTEIVSIFTRALAQRLFRNFSFGIIDKILGTAGGGGIPGGWGPVIPRAEGGPITGPGTGTSDSIPAMLSAGEHVMPAAKAAIWMPVLEAIRTGRLTMMGGGGLVQSVALGSIIPRRYAGGGVVMTDGGAAAVTPGGMGGNMMVSLHPEALNMTMRDWLEHEVVRQHSRR